MALIAPGSAEAAIDQQQNDASAQVTAMAAAGVTNCVNQTFTAGLSGNLDAIDLFLRGGTTYPLTIEVRTVGSGSLVSSGSVSAASVPDASGAFITIPLTPVAAVMATAQYVIVAIVSSPSGGSTESYTFGAGASDTSYIGGSGSVGCTGFTQIFRDLAFRTFVTAQMAVSLRSLAATRSGNGVAVRWRTASELETLGFNVYREVNGKRVRANTKLIAGKGRGLYSFLDRKAPKGKAVRYWIQAVNLDGSRSWYGPARIART